MEGGKICPKCGAVLDGDSAFCGKCGASLSESAESFCTQCGAKLEPGATFCSACGKGVSEMSGSSDAGASPSGPAPGRTANAPNNEPMRTISFAILIWGVFAAIFGAYCLIASDSIVQILKDTGTWQQFVDMGYTESYVKDIFVWSGALMLASGLTALLSAHFVYRGERFQIAFVMCLISTLFACTGIITFVIGLIVCYQIYKYKSQFKS